MVNQEICPLCNAQNQCALAQGNQAERCWCMSIKIPAVVLHQLPPGSINKQCICQRCAQSFNITHET